MVLPSHVLSLPFACDLFILSLLGKFKQAANAKMSFPKVYNGL